MKKDLDVIIFTVIYILIFPFIYAVIFHSLDAYLLFMIVLMFLSIPSLISVFILLLYTYKREKTFSPVIYIAVSFCLAGLTISFFKYSDGDPKNIYPIFEESILMLVIICLLSHCIAFIAVTLIKNRFLPSQE